MFHGSWYVIIRTAAWANAALRKKARVTSSTVTFLSRRSSSSFVTEYCSVISISRGDRTAWGRSCELKGKSIASGTPSSFGTTLARDASRCALAQSTFCCQFFEFGIMLPMLMKCSKLDVGVKCNTKVFGLSDGGTKTVYHLKGVHKGVTKLWTLITLSFAKPA